MENRRKTAPKRARTAVERREQKPADLPANSRRLSPPAALRAERVGKGRANPPPQNDGAGDGERRRTAPAQRDVSPPNHPLDRGQNGFQKNRRGKTEGTAPAACRPPVRSSQPAIFPPLPTKRP
ncbi:hypothetical protein HMPREF0262_02020 [Clostridium sp. ATCC 29733]|nr:hypothetical protein HMPREF0262_02020 [Clostridium sp. ATCC 29733]